jgi:hypothetical protein
VSNSLVEGGYAGPGNLDADPMFVDAIAAANAPSTGGDYHLQGTSPAVNVGDLALLPIDAQDLDGDSNTAEAIPFDRDGSARVARGGLDLGAYERQSNNAPTLTQPTDLTIREDAGAQSVNLVGIGSGDGSQTFSISVVSSNPALIPTPIVSYASPNATGSLTFTPAANLSGTATITITLQDSGGTANGGVDTLTRSFTITITSVNDAPSFTAGPNQTVQASAGAITVTGWASGFTPGPANEIGQTVVGYTVVSNSAPQLFSNAPVINTSGVLTYTPMPGASGTATIGVVVQDSGGTVNGGADTSVVYTFTITVAGSYTVNLPLVLGS